MPVPLSYVPTADIPHIPRDLAQKKMAKFTRPGPDGCSIWVGSRARGGNGIGILKVISHQMRPRTVFANKLAWWLAYGIYPLNPMVVAATCGHSDCVAIEHLRLQSKRVMTDEQVVEARLLFWTPFMQLNERLRRSKVPSAIQLAAWDLGMTTATVQAVVDGRPVYPCKWHGTTRDPADVLEAVAARHKDAAKRLAAKQSIWTQDALAVRYGVAQSTIQLVVHGLMYCDIPMPPQASTAVQRRGQDMFFGLVPKDDLPARRSLSTQRQQLAAEAALVMLPADAPSVSAAKNQTPRYRNLSA